MWSWLSFWIGVAVVAVGLAIAIVWNIDTRRTGDDIEPARKRAE